MEKDFKKEILKRIKEMDPNNEVVTIDEKNKKIVYNSQIVGGDKAKFENEGYVRAYLVVCLVKEKGYKMSSIILEQEYHIGSDAKSKSAYLDIRIKDKKNPKTTYMMIEVKSPEEYESKKKNIETQLFNLAAIQNSKEGQVRYLVYYTLDEKLDDKFIIIDFKEYPGYERWKTAILNGETTELALNKIPRDYGTVFHFNYGNVIEDDIFKPLNVVSSPAQLKNIKDELHNIFWGGGSASYNDVIFAINKSFICRIYDELTVAEGDPYKYQILHEDNTPEDPKTTYDRINKLYKKALVELFGVKQSEADKEELLYSNKISLEKFIKSVSILQSISLTKHSVEGDFLGEFFESIITNEFKQDKGQFFTHYLLCRFIVEALGIKQDIFKRISKATGMRLNNYIPYIIDPSCGSGTFLVEVVKSVEKYYEKNKHKFNLPLGLKRQIETMFSEYGDDITSKNSWASENIYGIEPNPDLETAAKLNLIFHGVREAKILKADGLASFSDYPDEILGSYSEIDMKGKTNYQINGKFDYIVSNPPFSLVIAMLKLYNKRFLYSDKKNSENLFIERWYQLLKEGGKLGVVLPDSIFDTTENKYIREFIYRYFNIDAIISIDKSAFQPYTSTKVSILLATKKTKKELSKYEDLWKQYAKEYRSLRQSNIIKFILDNDKLASSLERLCTKNGFKCITNRLLNEENFNFNYVKDLLTELIENDVFKIEDDKNELKDVLISSNNLDDIFNSKIVSKSLAKTSQYKLLNSIYLFVKEDELSKIDINESNNVLKDFLICYYPEDTKYEITKCEFIELLEHCYDDIISIAKVDYPNWEISASNKIKDAEYSNIWWTFYHISEELDYDIIRAEADNIGYKRTLRGEKKTKNDLMTIDENGDVIVDTDNPQTILDYIVKGTI